MTLSLNSDQIEVLNTVPSSLTTQPRPQRVHPGRMRLGILIPILVLLLFITMAVALSIGSVQVPFGQVWQVVAHRILPAGSVPVHWTASVDRIVADVRLPRVLLAAVAGMALTTVGTVVQALLRNPLASPTILGVSSGAATGAIITMRFDLIMLGALSLNSAAFIGAFITLFVVLTIARRQQQISATTLVLTGMAVSAVLAAVNNLMVLTSPDPQLASQVLFWSLGGFGSAQWDLLPLPTCVLILGIGYCLSQATSLNLLLGGEESAIALGLDVNRFRTRMFIVAAALVGVTVAVCGVIGFIGLVLPHITRILVGADHHRVLPVGLLVGAIFTVLADLLARIARRPEELPVGIITALVGGPFFLFLLRKTMGKVQ